ncbi:MAG: hypothetical protein ACOC36_00830 [Fibrobacterota bacterium]
MDFKRFLSSIELETPSQNKIRTTFEYQWYSLDPAEYKKTPASLTPKLENL